jgi:hypothetical protein
MVTNPDESVATKTQTDIDVLLKIFFADHAEARFSFYCSR